MNHKEKQSITHYISIRFAAIILIMAAIMILFISYFSNKTIYFDIRRQIRRESRYDFLNVEVRNGKILVDKNFIFRENHVQKLVLDSKGRTIRGHYPDKELNNYPLNQWDFRRVKCSSGYYYIFDRPFLKKDIITNKQILVIIRNIGKETIPGYEIHILYFYFCNQYYWSFTDRRCLFPTYNSYERNKRYC